MKKPLKYVEAGQDSKVDELYVTIKNTFGISFVPNFFKVIAKHHDVFDGIWTAYENILAEGELPLQVKEMIFLYTALEKGCVYCSSTHLAVCDMLNIESKNIHGLKNDLNKVTPKELQVVLKLIQKYIQDPKSILEEDREILKKMGFSDCEISEVICMVHLSYTAVSMALFMNLDDIENEINEYLSDNNLDTGLVC